jgi:hypothetical protein
MIFSHARVIYVSEIREFFAHYDIYFDLFTLNNGITSCIKQRANNALCCHGEYIFMESSGDVHNTISKYSLQNA